VALLSAVPAVQFLLLLRLAGGSLVSVLNRVSPLVVLVASLEEGRDWFASASVDGGDRVVGLPVQFGDGLVILDLVFLVGLQSNRVEVQRILKLPVVDQPSLGGLSFLLHVPEIVVSLPGDLESDGFDESSLLKAHLHPNHHSFGSSFCGLLEDGSVGTGCVEGVNKVIWICS